jgi:hypothetical protein
MDSARIFISFFVCFPRKDSGLSRRKNGRKCSGIRNLRKSRERVDGAQDVGVGKAGAHTMWHVEQFSAG